MILTYSPYNVLGEGEETTDTYGTRYVPRGYARAVADVIGTRNSSGCWDYGGAKEQQSGVDLVNFLARQEWSNGKVAMIGGSYDGTTANMVAARSAQAPGLAGIVPIAAISRWYGYAYSDGIRYSGNSQRPTDEGADTPLGFDFGFGRTPPTDPAALDAARDRIRPCDADLHTQKGYDTSPDYDAFWLERDYRKDAEQLRRPGADRPRLAGLQRQAGGGRRAVQGARRARPSRSSSCSRTATAHRPTRPSCPCSTRSSTASSRAWTPASRRCRP